MLPPESPRFSHLSTSRQALVRLCQSTNYGHIQDLAVRDREPIFSDSKWVVFVDVKLDSEDFPRAEIAASDFVLAIEIARLMALLDTIQDGKIARLEVRAGLPRRVTFEKRFQEIAGLSM